jgi:SAM-dependent methyltransferase
MKPHLSEAFRRDVVCPFCKTALEWRSDSCSCRQCGNVFEQRDDIWDFLPKYPPFLQYVLHDWEHGQQEYEEWSASLDEDLQEHLRGIEGVQEVYTLQFRLHGRILDVGGHQGRLRHFLPRDTEYLSVDPYIAGFELLQHQPNLVRAYPRLAEPCDFIRGFAERLPLRANAFDYVHMRSVLDHFYDPLLALHEARRVLRPGGGLLIGLYVRGGASSIPDAGGARLLAARIQKKIRDEGLVNTGRAIVRRILGSADHDEHIWHPTYQNLVDLLKTAHFSIEKVHWQKPPNDHVVYILGRKSS